MSLYRIQNTAVNETSAEKENIPRGLNRVNAAGMARTYTHTDTYTHTYTDHCLTILLNICKEQTFNGLMHCTRSSVRSDMIALSSLSV